MENIKKNLYEKEEKYVDPFTFIIHILALAITVINIIYNYSIDHMESLYFSTLILVSVLLAMLVYFKFKKHLLGAFIFVIGTSISISGILVIEGRISFNFLYYFAIILAIPFLVKRHENYVRDNYILFSIVALIAVSTLLIAPELPMYSIIEDRDIYIKMLINSTTSFITVVMFAVIIVYVSRNFFISFLKDKKRAEKEKDNRMVALTSLGHELRTQITSINGITQLIIEQKKELKPNNELLKKYATILDTCNDQMLSLVNDVLDIHKIESGKFELIEKPESLNNLLIEIANEYVLAANAKGIFFKTEIDTKITDLNLVFDKMRLQQIFKNLLSNAVKYTDEGFISFKVIIVEETSTNVSVLFKIEDSGIGILAENYSKIFESFQQIKCENSDIYGGTGLGLTLTKTILNNMGSTIEIESNINKGSIFSFKITFDKTSIKTNIEPIKLLIQNEYCLKGKNVLIADDNKVTLLYTDTLLKSYHAKVFLANNGMEAIEIAKTHKDIDFILLDLDMPRLNGFEAIEKLKAINPNQTIIAFTASIPDEELYKKLKFYGFDDFITKPFKKEELIRTFYKNCKEAKTSNIAAAIN
ncbi:response regulator [Xanthomarina sp. F1114]|uniref:ATP-binding response regulator n=1 Tax=Xanthomarina sp. F1114 TaxID=2996019 RepID=UPI00225E58D2|nr:response regulator [Xanthomarina sp. F1114]MCX7546976.1 response regulator [Xanthomarina sp. F1114]